MKNSNLESGIVFNFEIVKFTKVKANEFGNFRGKVNLVVTYDNPNGEGVVTVPVVATCSALCGFNFYQDKDKYVGKHFSSLNTDPDWQNNPFMLVKSKEKYYLYMVNEKGKRYVDVALPGGQTVKKVQYLYKKREDYVRFLDVDSIKK